MLKKYLVGWYSQTEEYKAKSEHTQLLKYGGNYSRTVEFKEQFKKTNFLRHGVDNPAKNKEVYDRGRKACKEKYDVESYSLTNEFRERAIRSSSFYNQLCENVLQYVVSLGDHSHILKCDICNTEFQHRSPARYRIINGIGLCPTCNAINNNFSFLEKELCNFIKSFYKGNCSRKLQKINKNPNANRFLELDILLPDLNFVIEFNGDYFHANPKNYTGERAEEIWKRTNLRKCYVKRTEFN